MRTVFHPLKAARAGFRRAALGVVAAALALSTPVAAQQARVIPELKMREDGTYAQPNTHRGFNLFAEEDLAGTSLRLSGIMRYTPINASGLCTFANSAGDLFNTNCGQITVAGGTSSTWFANNAVWGIGPDDYAKIKEVYPGVAGMRAPVGYSTHFRFTDVAPIIRRIDAADGQFGQLYSGVTSLTGAGCREFSGFSGGGLPENFTLTASSDCPETWPALGFDGIREIPDSVWLKRFQANPAAFRWDDWKVPKSDQADRPLGTNATYGTFSDYTREHLALYGGITPKGRAGAPPGERGFPIGILVRYDAWKFDRPSLRNGVFVRWLIVNNSEKVWGQPIDYDKIMFGVDPQYIAPSQSPALYNSPSRGFHIASVGNVSGRCNSVSFPKRLPPGVNEGCVGFQSPGSARASPRLSMILKSPLGDLRNKLFTDPTSDYFFPNHQEADDTLTFNHYVKGGFGSQEQFSWRRSDRALWGLLIGDEEAWLDGRQVTDFSAAQIWNFFRYEFTDGTQSLENLRYNRSVPGDIPGHGKWDYDDDGIQDTIKVPDCGSLGCSGLWGDSIAGGFANATGQNTGSFLGFGPFALKAGDTTEVIWYMGAAIDTLQMNRLIAAVTSAYFNNFAGASAYPTPVFTAADVQLNSAWIRDSTAGNQNTEVRIQVKMPPRHDDEFIKSVLTRLQQDDPIATNLRNLNPGLIAAVTNRMRQNLAQVLIFKSCDNGVSWTSASDCNTAIANFTTRDGTGSPTGIGWVPRFVLNADSITGTLSSHVISDIVPAGREYVYSAVTVTRGLFDIKVTTSFTTDAEGRILTNVVQNLQDVLGVDIDTITSPLTPNGAWTVRAYAPISVPAGTIYATLDTTRVQSEYVTNRVIPIARSATINGTFRMRFGNRWILTRTRDTVTNEVTTTLVRQSLYTSAATSPGGPRTANYVASADTFVSNHGITYSAPSANALRVTPRTTVGTVQTFVDTIVRPGYVIARADGATNAYYLAVGTSFLGNQLTQNTQQFEGDPWFPGFTVTVNTETAPSALRVAGGSSPVIVLRPERGPADTIISSVVASSGVVWNNASAVFNNAGVGASPGGIYKAEWLQEAWGGLGNNVRYGTVDELQPRVDAALAGRAVAMTADTTAATKARVIAVAAPPNSTRPLVAARVPFRFIGLNGQPVNKVAMFQRHLTGNVADSLFRNSRMLGTTGDTTRVHIPPDVWMPADTLFIFEDVVVDSTATVGGVANTVIVHDTVINGKTQSLPIQVERELVSLRVVLTCVSNSTPARTTCNPVTVGTRGGTGYLPHQPGWTSVFHLNRPFDQNSEIKLVAEPIRASALPLTKRDMNLVHVVPNPFIVQSGFDKILSNRSVDFSVIKFVNVPNEGLLRIYSISGQLMQQISWTATDLIASGNGSPHGDLPYNLRTREGLDLGSGLYVFVLTARGENANGQIARGKFVVIR